MTRTWLERAGLGLALLGIVAVALEVRRLGPELWSRPLGASFWVVVTTGAGIYGGLGFALAEAWRRWLSSFSGLDLRRRPAYSLYARTQIAKYLPGNVLHLASRHVAGRAWGVDHGSLVRAAVAEAGSLVACAGALSLGVLALAPDRLEEIPLSRFAAIWSIALAVLALLWLRHGRSDDAIGRGPSRRTALPSLGLHVVFFVVGGSLLLVLLRVTGQTGVGIVPAVSAWALAWMAGFVVPGAPAGLGVREWAFLALLGPTTDPQALLLSVLGLRAVTVLGDGLFVLYAGLGPRQPAGPGTASL